MRLQSENKVLIGDKMIGGPRLLICLPLVAETKADLMRQAQEAFALHPDLLEWRVDGYDNATDVADSMRTLAALRTVIRRLPLIFTCRIDSEGGIHTISRENRLQLILESIQSKLVDVIDIEMCNRTDFIDAVVRKARRLETRLIFSAHYFDAVPEEAYLVDKLFEARDMGADIAKVAVTAKTSGDALKLLRATWTARTTGLGIPAITMAMGSEGVLTRLAGGLFGSDITFAAGKRTSAPGQVPIEVLRQAMGVLYEHV